MSETSETRSLNLPEELVERVEVRAEAMEFASASAYVAYIIEEVLYTLESTDEPAETDDSNVVDRNGGVSARPSRR